jgi:hypothetical protein
MIQKIFITLFVIFIFLFGMRFLQKIISFKSKTNHNNDEKVVDLEKDPETNEYRPKQ